jgi:hypothetical protein
VLADQLVLALRFVHRYPSTRHDVQAVDRFELEIAQGGPEEHAAELGRSVLQREIDVPGVPDAAVRELAFHPDLGKGLLDQIPETDRQFGDREHAPRRHRSGGGRGFGLRLLFLEREIEQV